MIASAVWIQGYLCSESSMGSPFSKAHATGQAGLPSPRTPSSDVGKDKVATTPRAALTKCRSPGRRPSRSALFRFPIELAVDRAGSDAEKLRGEVLVAFGVAQRLADDAQLDLLHRGSERNRERPAFESCRDRRPRSASRRLHNRLREGHD